MTFSMNRKVMPMRERWLTLSITLLMLPMLAGFATAQDDSNIVVHDSRADRLDENSDGTFDIVRVTASIGVLTTAATLSVEVVAENEALSISFWNNTTLDTDQTFNIQTTVKAWADGEYNIWLRVWEAETGLAVHDQHLGAHDLVASLSPPMLSMDLEAEAWIFTGDTCLIHRTSTDLVGGHYDQMGVVSIQGVPWLVGEYETPVDCSRWPAGDYTIQEHYRNGLGMTATETISFTIHVHPPPAFEIEISGRNSEAGLDCELAVNATEGTMLPEMSIEWQVADPSQKIQIHHGPAVLDCTMWAPGVHKVRATLTSPQGRETTVAVNLIRLPPAPDASLAVLNASGDPKRWPSVSEGDEYEPKPLFYSLSASIALVGVGGFVLAIVLALIAVSLIDREKSEDDLWEDPEAEVVAPDSEGLASHVDENGVYWRQQPDGSVDWWDVEANQWLRFQQ